MSNLNLQKLREFDRGHGPLTMHRPISRYMHSPLSLDVCAGFVAGQKTKSYSNKTAVFPQNQTETDRPRPL